MTTATTPIRTSAAQEAFARSKGYGPGSELGYATANLWVDPSGVYRVRPEIKLGEVVGWLRETFSPATANVPLSYRSYQSFEAAVGATR